MMLAALLGVVFALGVLACIRGIAWGRRTLLSDVLSVDTASPQQQLVLPRTDLQTRVERAIAVLVVRYPMLGRLIGADLGADLRILGIDPTAHLVSKLAVAATALVVTPIVFGVMSVVVGMSILPGLWLGLLGAGLAFALPDNAIRRQAAERRRDFTATITSYLDLVALRTASGSGVSEALREASSVGTGYGWRRIRSALNDARFAGESPASGLAALGRDLDIVALTELASQLSLVEETGAQTEATLRAKSEALRTQARALMEGDAGARSTTMLLGQALLAFGFLVLIGYPALRLVVAM